MRHIKRLYSWERLKFLQVYGHKEYSVLIGWKVCIISHIMAQFTCRDCHFKATLISLFILLLYNNWSNDCMYWKGTIRSDKPINKKQLSAVPLCSAGRFNIFQLFVSVKFSNYLVTTVAKNWPLNLLPCRPKKKKILPCTRCLSAFHCHSTCNLCNDNKDESTSLLLEVKTL